VRSLHSPVWASRGRRVAPVEVDGMGSDESRRFLDRLEEHCLQPEFRYDHVHTPGDVTIWNNFATLHTAPPSKPIVNHPDDARLLYRISCKGDPSYELPRSDTDKWIAANISPPYRTPPQIPRVKHHGR
jgi:alpha-ketoglutarate-dependent taurine dioxygenase